ncbi:hypothetical protein BDBG_17272 [Blastomyces gilchristii SLH14081]|uniref:Uncharacterized protein n=2 Tax=Blastomyces TaxID=229219 RepID=A0A179UP09_BLAGS|nr:uncharacterized protein BDBG_17272 [Blastomyces gilchristii SLH14081]KMW66594.1 hypothetical protein BDDG_11602 [Blastomyces dermatitidis ATCC 18188]OAT09825.1 hypothetical protein BDBG_17272 [Blastomyces gilchristii SLH14081]
MGKITPMLSNPTTATRIIPGTQSRALGVLSVSSVLCSRNICERSHLETLPEPGSVRSSTARIICLPVKQAPAF